MWSREGFSLVAALVLVWGGWTLYQRYHDGGLGVEIARRALPGDIHMVASSTCVYCVQARAWFEAHGVRYDECFVDTDRACAEEYAAHGALGTPMLRVRGRWQLGFLPERVLAALGPPASKAE